MNRKELRDFYKIPEGEPTDPAYVRQSIRENVGWAICKKGKQKGELLVKTKTKMDANKLFSHMENLGFSFVNVVEEDAQAVVRMFKEDLNEN